MGATGLFGRSPAVRARLRSCTGWVESGGYRELIVPWLPGYENSSPVRIGNDGLPANCSSTSSAEIADAMFQALKGRHGAIGTRPCAAGPVVLDYLATAWRATGRRHLGGARAARQHFVHSKIMAWVAFDRAGETSWNLKAFHEPGGTMARDSRRNPCRGLRSAVSTRTLTALCRPTASKRPRCQPCLLIPMVGFSSAPRTRGSAERFGLSRIDF